MLPNNRTVVCKRVDRQSQDWRGVEMESRIGARTIDDRGSGHPYRKTAAVLAAVGVALSTITGCSNPFAKEEDPATQLTLPDSDREVIDLCNKAVYGETTEIIGTDGKPVAVPKDLYGFGERPVKFAHSITVPVVDVAGKIKDTCVYPHAAAADLEFMADFTVNGQTIKELNPELYELNQGLIEGKKTTRYEAVVRNASAAWLIDRLFRDPEFVENLKVGPHIRTAAGADLKVAASERGWYGPTEIKKGYLAKRAIIAGYYFKDGGCVIEYNGKKAQPILNPDDGRLGIEFCVDGKKVTATGTSRKPAEKTRGPVTPKPEKTKPPKPEKTKPPKRTVDPKNPGDSSGSKGGGMDKPGGGGKAPAVTGPATKPNVRPPEKYIPPAAPSAGRPNQPPATEPSTTPAPEKGSTPGDGGGNSGDPGGF